MGLTNSNKELSTEKINCNETFKVKLSLTAEPDITSNPADIVLVLDRSGSMQGQAIEDLKVAANAFIDIIEEATDGVKDGIIGNGSHRYCQFCGYSRTRYAIDYVGQRIKRSDRSFGCVRLDQSCRCVYQSIRFIRYDIDQSKICHYVYRRKDDNGVRSQCRCYPN